VLQRSMLRSTRSSAFLDAELPIGRHLPQERHRVADGAQRIAQSWLTVAATWPMVAICFWPTTCSSRCLRAVMSKMAPSICRILSSRRKCPGPRS